jgi:hypothetical protein
MSETKPCPLCGPEHVDRLAHSLGRTTCTRCGCAAYVDRWQARPIEDALRKERDEALKEAADAIHGHLRASVLFAAQCRGRAEDLEESAVMLKSQADMWSNNMPYLKDRYEKADAKLKQQISRTDAIKISNKILEDTEKERITIAGEEAQYGIL